MSLIDLKKPYFSTTEVACILHISRVAVHKKIKTGNLSAQKVGRNYIIAKERVRELLGTSISEIQKSNIEAAVKKAVAEYRVAFRRLGEEK